MNTGHSLAPVLWETWESRSFRTNATVSATSVENRIPRIIAVLIVDPVTEGGIFTSKISVPPVFRESVSPTFGPTDCTREEREECALTLNVTFPKSCVQFREAG